jgi:hypothetical protein
MNHQKKLSEGDKGQPTQPPKRIWTQIHRRKKAKAEPQMTDEWEDQAQTPPSNLRMPPENMEKH